MIPGAPQVAFTKYVHWSLVVYDDDDVEIVIAYVAAEVSANSISLVDPQKVSFVGQE
jgi:hypothetical protein